MFEVKRFNCSNLFHFRSKMSALFMLSCLFLTCVSFNETIALSVHYNSTQTKDQPLPLHSSGGLLTDITEPLTVNDDDETNIGKMSVNKFHRNTSVEPVMSSFDKGLTMNSIANEHLTDQCNLTLSNLSISRFRYKVRRGHFNFAFTKLKFLPSVNVTIKKSVIEGLTWTWTYFGNNGGLFLLKRPPEAILWSLGLLQKTVGGIRESIELELITNNCTTEIEIGNLTSTYRIGNALKDILSSLYENVNPDYAASYWCYWERRYIDDRIYILCLHVVCPIPLLQYRCCVNYFQPSKMRRELDCGGKKNTFTYERLWYIPFVSGCIFFLNMPLFVFWFAWRISSESATLIPAPELMQISDTSEDGLHIQRNLIIFVTEKNCVTILNTMFDPCLKWLNRHPVFLSRLKRITFVILTLSFVAAQIVLDSIWTLNEYISACLEAGVPMGFRSLREGYNVSRKNFLPFLGGPITALSAYVLVSISVTVFPVDLPSILEHGLSERTEDEIPCSPLLLSNKVVQRLSSVKLSTCISYRRLVDFFQINIFCILNYKFWLLTFKIQKSRFLRLRYVFLRVFFFLPYIGVCITETLLSVILYGFPLFIYIKLVFKAYMVCVFIEVGKRVKNMVLRFLLRFLSLSLIFCALVFHSFMLCTLFLDAVILISRIFIYSYEGIVLYPKISYGYIIFAVTVLYYIVKIKNEYSRFYQNILRQLIKISLKQNAVYWDGSSVVKIQDYYRGVPADLFEEVLERVKPRRIKLFIALTKMAVICFIAGITTELMLAMDNFDQVEILVHVGTTLFICALPKLMEQISSRKDRLASKKLEAIIVDVLKKCVGSDFTESQSMSVDMYERQERFGCDNNNTSVQ